MSETARTAERWLRWLATDQVPDVQAACFVGADAIALLRKMGAHPELDWRQHIDALLAREPER